MSLINSNKILYVRKIKFAFRIEPLFSLKEDGCGKKGWCHEIDFENIVIF